MQQFKSDQSYIQREFPERGVYDSTAIPYSRYRGTYYETTILQYQVHTIALWWVGGVPGCSIGPRYWFTHSH